MRKLVFTSVTLLFFQSCSFNIGFSRNSCDDENLITKIVRFKPNETRSFLYPEFLNKSKNKHSMSFLIRKPQMEMNTLTSNINFKNENLYWILEKALIREQHTVVDPSLYNDWKTKNSKRSPKFDFILEIMEASSINFHTGIKNKILKGSFLTIKIINPITTQTVGILQNNRTPCTSGCEFKYTECEIKSQIALPIKTSYPKNFLSQGFSTNDIYEIVRLMRNP